MKHGGHEGHGEKLWARRGFVCRSRTFKRFSSVFSVSSVVAMLLAVAATAASAKDLPEPVRAALARAGVPASAASIVVEPVGDGPALVDHEAKAAVNPASVMKLITTFAALDLLGPAFTFHTDFLVQ